MDKLTGLLAKKEFEEQLQHEVQRAMRYRRPLTLLIAEVDFEHFEAELNIRTSMPYTILKQVGAIIQKHLRTVDMAGRVAGETFAMMLPETPLDGAKVAAERLRMSVESHEFLGDNVERRLRMAIETHRDQTGHNMCWLNDWRLWQALGDAQSPNPDNPKAIPPEREFQIGCRAYYASRFEK